MDFRDEFLSFTSTDDLRAVVIDVVTFSAAHIKYSVSSIISVVGIATAAISNEVK